MATACNNASRVSRYPIRRQGKKPLTIHSFPEFLKHMAKEEQSIPYQPKLNQITGSIEATLLLQQTLYHYLLNGRKSFRRFKQPCTNKYYKDGSSWAEELGLNKYKVNKAIKTLGFNLNASAQNNISKEDALIHYYTDGTRQTRWSINEKAFLTAITLLYPALSGSELSDREKMYMVLEGIDKTISYYPVLSKITGSLEGSLFLQQVIYHLRCNKGQPFYKFNTPCDHANYRPGDSWQEELGITRRKLDRILLNIAFKKNKLKNKFLFNPETAFVYYRKDRWNVTWYKINQKAIIKAFLQEKANGENVHSRRGENVHSFISTDTYYRKEQRQTPKKDPVSGMKDLEGSQNQLEEFPLPDSKQNFAPENFSEKGDFPMQDQKPPFCRDELKKEVSLAQKEKIKAKFRRKPTVPAAVAYWKNCLSEYDYSGPNAFTMTKKDHGMMRHLISRLQQDTLPYLEFIVSHWKILRKFFVKGNGISKLPELPSFEQAYYLKDEIFQVYKNGVQVKKGHLSDKVETTYKRVEDVPKNIPGYAEICRTIQLLGSANVISWKTETVEK